VGGAGAPRHRALSGCAPSLAPRSSRQETRFHRTACADLHNAGLRTAARGAPAQRSGITAQRRRTPKTPEDETALVADIVELARTYGRYGYRRINALLRAAGWLVNVKRVERIWRRERLADEAAKAGPPVAQ
jgi:transposase InsO family protein